MPSGPPSTSRPCHSVGAGDNPARKSSTPGTPPLGDEATVVVAKPERRDGCLHLNLVHAASPQHGRNDTDSQRHASPVASSTEFRRRHRRMSLGDLPLLAQPKFLGDRRRVIGWRLGLQRLPHDLPVVAPRVGDLCRAPTHLRRRRPSAWSGPFRSTTKERHRPRSLTVGTSQPRLFRSPPGPRFRCSRSRSRRVRRCRRALVGSRTRAPIHALAAPWQSPAQLLEEPINLNGSVVAWRPERACPVEAARRAVKDGSERVPETRMGGSSPRMCDLSYGRVTRLVWRDHRHGVGVAARRHGIRL